ncbi:MAG: glutaredoxin domain-containing protein, partial [Alphaproteobacteria bacterium]
MAGGNSVFLPPPLTKCVWGKEFLSVRGIEFKSINVLEDEGGLDALKALGAKSIPVVSRDGKFVFAQLIKDVVEFLGINEDVSPTLSPAELVARGDLVWEAAARFCAQMPDSALDKELPNRPRSYRVLMHHLFQIPTAFLDARRDSTSLTYEALVSPPPEGVSTGADIA